MNNDKILFSGTYFVYKSLDTVTPKDILIKSREKWYIAEPKEGKFPLPPLPGVDIPQELIGRVELDLLVESLIETHQLTPKEYQSAEFKTDEIKIFYRIPDSQIKEYSTKTETIKQELSNLTNEEKENLSMLLKINNIKLKVIE